MSKDATAKIVFELENAEEVLQLMRQLKAFVEGGAGAANGGSVAGATPAPGVPSSVGSAAPPVGAAPVGQVQANPGAVAAQLPQNMPFVATAANAGGMFGTWTQGGVSGMMYDPTVGRFFDPTTGAYYLQGAGFGYGGAGGAAKPASPPPASPTGFQNVIGAMAAFGVGQVASQAAGQAAGSWAESRVNGDVFHPERLIPPLTTIGLIGGGALIGGAATAWSGPGALVGAGVGALLAGVAGDAIRPIIERNIKEDELRRFAYGVGYLGNRGDSMISGLPNDMLDAMAGDVMSGRYLGTGTYAGINRRFSDSPYRRQLALDTMQTARYADGNVIRLGVPSKTESLTLSERADLYEGAAYGNELQMAQGLENEGLVRKAGQVRKRYETRVRLEDAIEGGASEVSSRGFYFNRAAKYGGSRGAMATGGAYVSEANAQAYRLRAQADMMEDSDPGGALSLRNEADRLELETADTVADTVFGLKMEEAGATFGLESGRAGRQFTRSLYGGVSAAGLPYGQQQTALRAQARRLEGLMRERGDRLSPAERDRMTEEIESLKFRAEVELPVDREGRVNSERLTRAGLDNSRMFSSQMPGILSGSLIDQTKESDLQVQALGRIRNAYEEILRTSQYLTAEQRMQYQTQVENLKVEQERARVSGIYGRNAAIRQTAETYNVESGVAPSIALIQGAGGAAGAGAMASLLQLTDSNIAASRAELNANIMSGMSPDSPQNQAIRTRLASMQIARENQQRGLAIAPMSAEDRATNSTLATQAAFYSAGYGSFGDIRGNLLAQIGQVEKRMDELGTNRDNIRAGRVAGVKWTDAMEADYIEARNATALQALQLSEQYNYGYDQRLISSAYNMPGQGRLGMSQFTRREAAAAGVFHRAFGGSESQTRQMREMYPAAARALGSGSPANFGDRAIGGEAMRAYLEVQVTVVDPNGRIKDNAVQVTNQKTSTDMTVNVQGAKRQAG